MLETVIAFLRSIGLEVTIVPGANGFTKGVRIVDGGLHVDPDCRPSALLHEAGHVSTVPGRFRAYMNDDIAVGVRKMFAEIQSMNLDPEHPLERAAIQCSDPDATAWAWAAGLAIGLAPEAIIMDDEYFSGGNVIRTMLSMCQYAGINGLAKAGMCKRGYMVKQDERYPVMTKWLQDY